jgi:hypothetical protein
LLFGTRTFFVLTLLDFRQPTVAVHTLESWETPIKNTVLNLCGPEESTPDTKLLKHLAESQSLPDKLVTWKSNNYQLLRNRSAERSIRSLFLVLAAFILGPFNQGLSFRKTNQQFLFSPPTIPSFSPSPAGVGGVLSSKSRS